MFTSEFDAEVDESESATLQQYYREAMIQAYNFGFEVRKQKVNDNDDNVFCEIDMKLAEHLKTMNEKDWKRTERYYRLQLVMSETLKSVKNLLNSSVVLQDLLPSYVLDEIRNILWYWVSLCNLASRCFSTRSSLKRH